MIFNTVWLHRFFNAISYFIICSRRREGLAVHVRRDAVLEESFRKLHRRSADEVKNRFNIVFEGEVLRPLTLVKCFAFYRRGGSRCWRIVQGVIRHHLQRH